MTRRRGSVLILALWSVSVLAILAVTLGAGTRQKLTLLKRLESIGALESAARNGVEKSKALLRETDLTEKYDALTDDWADSEGHFREIAAPGATVNVGYMTVDPVTREARPVYGLIDEERRLNLNRAPAEVYDRLLKLVAGIEEEDEREALAYAIVDWRDQDSNYGHPSLGAEDDDYEDGDRPYEAKDGPYEAIEELLLVKGMTRPIFDKIRPFVTAHGSGSINLNTAPHAVFLAAGLSPALADKLVAYRAGTDAAAGTPDDLSFTDADPSSVAQAMARMTPLDGQQETELANALSSGVFTTVSTAFESISRARLDNGRGELEIRAVIDRRGKVHSYRVSKVQWS